VVCFYLDPLASCYHWKLFSMDLYKELLWPGYFAIFHDTYHAIVHLEASGTSSKGKLLFSTEISVLTGACHLV
jgi:hypothetical protein